MKRESAAQVQRIDRAEAAGPLELFVMERYILQEHAQFDVAEAALLAAALLVAAAAEAEEAVGAVEEAWAERAARAALSAA